MIIFYFGTVLYSNFYGNFGQIMVIDFQVNNVAHGPRLKTTDVLYSVHLLLSPHLTSLPDAPY